MLKDHKFIKITILSSFVIVFFIIVFLFKKENIFDHFRNLSAKSGQNAHISNTILPSENSSATVIKYQEECFKEDADPKILGLKPYQEFELADKQIRSYRIHCDYVSISYIYEIYANNERIKLFSGIINPYPDETPIDQQYFLMYLRMPTQTIIYNIQSNQEFRIATTLSCNSLRAVWFNGFLLLTGKGLQLSNPDEYATVNCIFSNSGEKLFTFTANLKFIEVAPGYAIANNFGLKIDGKKMSYYIDDDNFELIN
ncbi:MAG: hypothetical protein WCJ58_07655 [bacterium]